MELQRGFESRLQSLQRLCSSKDDQYPAGLLFIPGVDGKSNKGSATILKYLFEGAVNNDLLDGTLSDKLEALEELVLLIQETSVSVVYTRDMKEQLKPWFAACPLLIEYIPTVVEEGDVDSLQERKCVDFKRMMLEAVPEGASIGIPIPLGYEGVMDVETWPILQAFAMEEVYCSTGFFTQRYNVVDITEFLDILYCTLDTPHVNYAIRTMHQSVIPHMEQSISILDALTADQRVRVTMEDVVGPLDMLFEFGELQASSATDPTLRPIVLVGQDTLLLGASSRSELSPTWLQSKVGSRSTHCVVEACEPSSGMRWCRTYLLQRGKRLPTIKDTNALVQLADQDDESAHADGDIEESDSAAAQLATVAAVISRLEAVAAKLAYSLRWSVREAFSQFTDVLEAGQHVQQTMDAIMKGHNSVYNSDKSNPGCAFPPGLGLDVIKLSHDEYLQVHMDCMNGHGKVVNIDDIDDMGGTCWTYIRVSVHRIGLGGSALGVVAVGDTFLFSGTVEAESRAGKAPRSIPNSFSKHFLATDAYCITHLVPYNRYFSGAGVEERSSKKLVSWLKSPDMVSTLGLGKLLESSLGLVGQITHVPALTDHPLVPFANSTLRGFSGGFLIERLNTACLPLLFSIETHAECMWTVDLRDCLEQAQAALQLGDAGVELSAPPGIMVIFKLKSFTAAAVAGRDAARQRQEDEEDDAIRKELDERKAKFDSGFGDTLDVYSNSGEESSTSGLTSIFKMGGMTEAAPSLAQVRNERRQLEEKVRRATKSVLEFNPLERTLPTLPDYEPRYIALCVLADSRASQALSDALKLWRDALRLHDVPEYRGNSLKEPLPKEILTSFVAYLDHTVSASAIKAEEDVDEAVPADVVLSCVRSARTTLGLPPGSAFIPMRCLHALNETSRLMTAKPQEGGGMPDETAEDGKSDDSFDSDGDGEAIEPLKLVVVLGHAGSCPLLLGSQIAERTGKLLLAAEREEDPNSETTASELACSMAVDLSALGQKGAKTPEETINTAWMQSRKNGQVSLLTTKVLVVSIVTNPSHHVRMQELLSLLAFICARNYNTVDSDSRSMINRGCIVSCIVSTLCPESVLSEGLETSSADSEDTAGVLSGLGVEAWRGCGLCASHSGQVCDVAIAIDGSSSGRAFGAFRGWLSRFNENAVAVRVGPSNLRLDAYVLDIIVARLNTSKVIGSVVAKPLCGAKSYGTPLPCNHTTRNWAVSSTTRVSQVPLSTLRVLQLLKISPPANSNKGWSVNSLTATLKVLFPGAIVNNNVAGDTWKIPAATEHAHLRGLSGLRLAAALAQIKVMTKRQCEEEQQLFAQNLAAALEPFVAASAPTTTSESKKKAKAASAKPVPVRHTLVPGLLSVHGIITVPVGNPLGDDAESSASSGKGAMSTGLAVVEACSGSIVVRYLDNSTYLALLSSCMAPALLSGTNTNNLNICGVVDNKDSSFLDKLFGLCGRYQLLGKPDMTRQDVVKHQIVSIQKSVESQKIPLPNDCWWNGTSYVDHMGSAQPFRPDLEPYIDQWIQRRNKKIAEYNDLLVKMRDFL